jgi:hypothetical protein
MRYKRNKAIYQIPNPLHTITLSEAWFAKLTDRISVFESLYQWLESKYQVDPYNLHNRVFVGRDCMTKLLKAEKKRIARQYGYTGHTLEKALAWSDLGAGPLTYYDNHPIIGEKLFVADHGCGHCG